MSLTTLSSKSTGFLQNTETENPGSSALSHGDAWRCKQTQCWEAGILRWIDVRLTHCFTTVSVVLPRRLLSRSVSAVAVIF